MLTDTRDVLLFPRNIVLKKKLRDQQVLDKYVPVKQKYVPLYLNAVCVYMSVYLVVDQ